MGRLLGRLRGGGRGGLREGPRGAGGEDRRAPLKETRLPRANEVEPRLRVPEHYVRCANGLEAETDEGRAAEEFENLMGHASFVAEADPTALADLVRLLAREVEARYATLALGFEGDAPVPFWLDDLSPWFGNEWSLDGRGRTFSDLRRDVTGHKPALRLGIDPVVPNVWNSGRLERTLTDIGAGRPNGPWLQDPTNHRVDLLLPLGVGIVTNGNHSIAAGIAQCAGYVTPDHVYDISEVYEHVGCDGRSFYRLADGFEVGPVLDPRWAAVFEIGRLMTRNR